MFPQIKPSKKTIYLDHAATTYLDPRVKKAMEPFWSEQYGNPSSLYKQGREGSGAVSRARKTIADILNAKPNEIIFTAGGTESINLAIQGIARQYRLTHQSGGHIIVSAIEHHAVLHTVEALEQEGFAKTILNTDAEGVINPKTLQTVIRKDTILVSVMYANNEIGTIEPIVEIGKLLKKVNVLRIKNHGSRILFHTDACQAAGSLELDVQKLGVDLLSANGSKIYGPKQTGFLYARSGVKLRPIIFGGGQERNLRSGTENVAGIVGLAEALRITQKDRLKENTRLITLRDYFINQLLKKIPSIKLNGPAQLPRQARGRYPEHKSQDNLKRLPNNVSVSIQDIEGEALTLYLDSYNIAASTGSACSSQSLDPSHVLVAIGKSEFAHNSIRFTLGRETSKSDIDYVLKILPGVIKELQRIAKNVNINRV